MNSSAAAQLAETRLNVPVYPNQKKINPKLVKTNFDIHTCTLYMGPIKTLLNYPFL